MKRKSKRFDSKFEANNRLIRFISIHQGLLPVCDSVVNVAEGLVNLEGAFNGQRTSCIFQHDYALELGVVTGGSGQRLPLRGWRNLFSQPP